MLKRKRLYAWTVIILLYIVTWVGGWLSHRQYMRERVKAAYVRTERRNQEMEAEYRKAGMKEEDFYINPQLFKDGPESGVDWCFPLLPGLLLAESHRSIGPLARGGDTKVILYYGFGSVVLCSWISWRA